MTESEERYSAIVTALVGLHGVTLGADRGFAKNGLKVGGKLFACVPQRGGLLLKLPKARVDWLNDAGDGERFDPGHGRPLKEWVVVRTTSMADWLDLAREAMTFVGGAE